ncbi:MAG: PD-(D/E)XK nuclease family protein [Planctomycetes bacterium]|nr:PD-(D/E)XK nuclease family protein [Planctomycetota bacterium]
MPDLYDDSQGQDDLPDLPVTPDLADMFDMSDMPDVPPGYDFTDDDQSDALTEFETAASADAEPGDFLDRLASTLRVSGQDEAVLLAPSRRVGRQWLDRLVLRTGSVAGVRVTTLSRLMMDSADGELKRRGLQPMRREEAFHLVGTAFSRVAPVSGEGGYFTRLAPGFDLAGTILSALNDLDESGVQPNSFMRALASREKADELAALYGRFQKGRRQAGLAGGADVAAAALVGLDSRRDRAPTLMVPSSILDNAGAGERQFLDAWPAERRVVVREDDGPAAGSIHFNVADCVADEARSVFRFLLEKDIPLDQAEIVCVDVDGYLPAILTAAREAFPVAPDELPLTSHAGLPIHLSRPARLLAAWLDWLATDVTPSGLARMLWDGLLREGWRDGPAGIDGSRFAAHLLTLPINTGPGDWLAVLGRSQPDTDADLRAAEDWLARTLPEILPLAAGTGGARLDLSRADEVLRAAEAVLALGAGGGKFDAYARKALRETILAWRPWCDWPGFDAVAWLGTCLRSLKIMGLGPQPGRVHIAGMAEGGHSGREWTFVLGLDDSRFPGGSRQDPVLLDKERRHLSRRLEPSGRARRRREEAMRRLLARLDRQVVVSHSLRDGPSGRPLFASGLYSRLRSRMVARSAEQPVNGDSDNDNVCADGGAVVDASAKRGVTVRRPMADRQCLSRRDEWLLVLLRHDANALVPDDIALWHPALAAGATALRARAGDAITAYDGLVPEAGRAFLDGSRPLSPSNLEQFAKSPSDFFFRTVLGVKPPDRFEPTPGVWLQANERGTLLHDVFQDFLTDLVRDGTVVSKETHDLCRARLSVLVEQHINRWRRRRPPQDDLAFRREVDELFEACVIFLAVEQTRQESRRPLAFEAAIGGAAEDDPPWRRIDPVPVQLPSGRTVTLRGRVDRVDQVDADGGLEILDYKTGSGDKYSRRDPFQGGRRLQPFLYVEMLTRALADAGLPRPVRGFSYYFPMPRDEGKIITYSREQLSARGWEIMEILGELLAGGLFLLSGREDDVRYSDYRVLYGATGEACRQALRKAETDDTLLQWLAMRKE